MNERLTAELLAQILEEYGPEIFRDEEELSQAVEDVFSDPELEEEQELFLRVAASGALSYVADFPYPDTEIPDSYEPGRARAVKLLTEDGLPEELAEYAVERMDEALGLSGGETPFDEE